MDFPIDILSMIVAFSDQQSLAILLRTSRLFKTIAEPLLYRNITFNAGWEGLKPPSCIEKFKDRIVADPRLAMYVVWYATRSGHALSKILPELRNLRRLKIYENSLFPYFHKFNKYFSPTTCLTHLICHDRIDDIPAFCHFLESQPSLEVLDFHFSAREPGELRLPSDALPRLHTLDTSAQFAIFILSGRNICHLTLYDSDINALFDILSNHTFPAVQTLCFFVGLSSTEIASLIAHHFPNVTHLCPPAWGFRALGRFSLDEVINFLQPLAASKIHYVHLRMDDHLLAIYKDDLSAGTLATCLKELQSLRILDVGFCRAFRPTTIVIFRHHAGCTVPVEMTLPVPDLASWELWWQCYGLEWSLRPSDPDVSNAGSAGA